MDKEIFIIIPWIIMLMILASRYMNLPMDYVKSKAEKRMRDWLQTNGTITGLKRGGGSRGKYAWTLTYAYLDDEGKQHDQKCVFSAGKDIPYSVNNSIRVWFDKKDPKTCRTEIELSEVGFLDRKTKQLKSENDIQKSLRLDIAAVIISVIMAVIADFAFSYTRGAAIAAYLIVLGICIGLGYLRVRKYTNI